MKILNKLKWYVFVVFVAYYHWKQIHCHGYGAYSCFKYALSFDNFFEDVQWRTIISDAEEAVDEDFSYWG